jgi:hypothetical protein
MVHSEFQSFTVIRTSFAVPMNAFYAGSSSGEQALIGCRARFYPKISIRFATRSSVSSA